MIQAIFSKYLMEGILLLAVTVGFSFLKNKLGKDRTEVIKEALLTAMLWAEEEFGIGEGERKWEEAWNKLLEILKGNNIILKAQETGQLKALMKANISRVNNEHYNALLKKEAFYQKEEALAKLMQLERNGADGRTK